MNKIKILLADDQEIIRNGVRHLIEQEDDMAVVAEASNGVEAVLFTQELNPDVLIMDVILPKMSGIEVARKLLKQNPELKILFFSHYSDEENIVHALNLGAFGYVLKDESNRDFFKAIRNVAQGNYYFSGDTSNAIVKNIKGNVVVKSVAANVTEEAYHLSKRETEILCEIASGLSNKDIAEQLNVSIRTIETHRLNIMRKLSVNSIELALQVAKREGILSM